MANKPIMKKPTAKKWWQELLEEVGEEILLIIIKILQKAEVYESKKSVFIH